MRFLDLCAGIGGFSLGLERAGMSCVGQVEIDDHCRAVLGRHWPGVPRWSDIRTLQLETLPACDLICGGYPCQPFSTAGQRRGSADDRHLWPFVLGVVQALRPAWCLFENVAGHVSLGLDRVWSDLEAAGYAVQPLIIPACAVGAPHRRDRVWILANSQGQPERPGLCPGATPGQWRPRLGHGRDGAVADASGGRCDGLQKQQGEPSAGRRWPAAHGHFGTAGIVGDSDCEGLQIPQQPGDPGQEECREVTWSAVGQRGGSCWADAEWVLCRDGKLRAVAPGVPLLAHGIPGRVGQAKAYGNTVIPEIVETIGRAIMAAQQEAA